MEPKHGLLQRTGEPFLPICDHVQPVRDRSSFEVQRHRLEVSAMELGISERGRVRRGKSRDKRSDEGLHDLKKFWFLSRSVDSCTCQIYEVLCPVQI